MCEGENESESESSKSGGYQSFTRRDGIGNTKLADQFSVGMGGWNKSFDSPNR